MNETTLTSALNLLGEFLAEGASPPVWLVVGGGSALLVQRLSNRPTKDVDVMALREWEGNVIIEDLQNLKPTRAETEQSLRWVLRHLHASTTHPKLHHLLQELGHAALIPEFP